MRRGGRSLRSGPPVRSRTTAGVLACAVAGTLGMALVVAPSPASARSDRTAVPGLGAAEASPNSGLRQGSIVAVSISGFPANALVAAVQCDRRVLAEGDTYCDTNLLQFGAAGPDGTGTFPFVVRTGAAFLAAASDAACDARHDCEIAVQTITGDEPVQALASITFGTDTRTTIQAAPRAVKPGARVRIRIEVAPKSASPANGLVPISGRVTLKDRNTVVGRYPVPADGVLVVDHRITAGKHRLAAVYPGDENYRRSLRKVVVRATR